MFGPGEYRPDPSAGMGVIAPFPNLTVLDIGTRKEFSLTV
jgi:hypothetical protein